MAIDIRLGPYESRLLFALWSQDTDLFDLQEAQKVLDVPRQSAAEVLHRLRRKGRVVAVRKGTYLVVPPHVEEGGAWSETIYRVVDVLLEEDYYVGFWSAMNYWEMTEQIPRVTHVAVLRRRRLFAFHGQRVRFVTLKPERLFGSVRRNLQRGGFYVSDRERTVVDSLLLPRYSGGMEGAAQALAEAGDELDWNRMAGYVERLAVDAVRRRLGYLLEELGLASSLRRRLRRPSPGFRWLDPSGPKERLSYSKRWGLIVNIPREEMLAGG